MSGDYERWIEAYLDGELSDEDRVKLEAWLRESPENVRTFVRATHADTATQEAVAGAAAREGACPVCAEPGASVGLGRPWWRGRFAALAAAVILLNLGGLIWIHWSLTRVPLPTVRVLTVSPTTNADLADRVTLTFDRNVAPAELVGKVEPAALFELSPAWPGQWQWAKADTLEYRLDKPFPPGRTFRLRAAGGLATRTGKQLEGEKDFAIRTRALALKAATVTACDNAKATVEFTFNQPVEPGELLRHMRARDGKDGHLLGEGVLLTKAAGEKIVVQFNRPASEQLRISLDAELTGSKGELPLGKAVVQEFAVTSRFILMNVRGEQGSLSEPGRVYVNFSHDLGRQDVQVKVEPAVEGLKVERGYSDSALRLHGSFEPGKAYTITVPGTVADEQGQTLGQACSGRVEMPELGPQVAFPHGQGVLSPLGTMEVDLDVLNVKEVQVTSWRLYENNLVSYLRRGGYYEEDLGRYGKEKTVKLDAPKNRTLRTAISLPGVIEGSCGVFRVKASPVGQWQGDEAVVVLTDLALTVKTQRGGYLVWVTSLRTAQPVADAIVKAVSRTNQPLAMMRTDKDGLARLVVPEKHPDGACWVLTAQKDKDLAYLLPEENQWVLDDVAQGGRPYAAGYEVMAYTDRGVYRPGEEVYLTGIIRDAAGAIPPAFPLTVKVIRPDGRAVADLPVTPGEGAGGFFHLTYPTAADGQTGPYRFRVTLPGSEDVIGETHAQVEAFLPVRMEVKASTTAAYFGPGEKPRVNVSSRYLWNQPGAGLPVALEPVLTARRFTSASHAGWQFGGKVDSAVIHVRKTKGDDEEARGKGILRGNLNDKGEITFDVELPEKLPKGFYAFSAAATVTDARSVSATAKADVDTLGLHVGLRAPKDLVAVGEVVPVEWVRLTGRGENAPAGEMKTKLVRVEYDSVLKRSQARRHRGATVQPMVWESVERLIDVKADAIAAGAAAGKVDVVCPEGGHYRLIVTDAKTGSETWLELYTGGGQSVAMEKPERVEIVTDQPKYTPGATAKVLLRSAVPGTVLLTLETDRVVGYYLGEVKERTAEMEVPIPESVRGGAFLTATVVRAVDPAAMSWLPHRAMGMARLTMDHKAGELPVTLKAPDKARPLETVSVTVETGAPSDPTKPAMVHLWAVDEGILLCAAYTTPDPRGYFFSPRSLGVATADSFFRLLPDFARPASVMRIGADGGGASDHNVDSLRRNPVPTRLRTPAVVWRTVAPADATGRLSVEVKLPDRIGQMRFMAVAADGDRYGRAQQATTVTSPLIVEATWPRFAAPGDTFHVPVKLFNSTDKAMTVRVRTPVTGPVVVKGDPALEKVTVAPGTPASLTLAVEAADAGPVEVAVIAEQLDAPAAPERAECKFNFPVRPGGGLHTDVQLVAVPAGKPMTLATPATFAAGPVRTRVQVAAAPNVQLAAAMERLVGYPYGCVEQTSSKLMGLLYAADVMGESRAAGVDEMIKAGIARLWSMQTASGGLGYWPGDAEANEWGTAYAASVLAEAKAAGHKVDPRLIDPLVKYLQGTLRGTEDREADPNVKAAVCRVLAVFGKPAEGWMSQLAERKDKLDLAGRVDLAGAFLAVGRKDRAAALLPDQPTSVARSTGERLVSQVRAEGMWLLLLLESDPNNPLAAQLAGRLEQARKGQAWWGTTLDNAAAVAALARYQTTMAGKAPANFSGTIRIAQEAPVAFTHAKAAQALSQIGGEVVIAAEGTGTVYAVVSREGLAAEGAVKPYDKELVVRRQWLDSADKPVDPRTLHVGDLVYVEVTLRKPGGPDVHNVAIVDALPGAMEVENPALATSSSSAADTGRRRHGRQANAADHVEFLDDRVVLFCDARDAEATFRYALRVTAAGQFALPAIQASCMYDPSVASLGEGGRVKAEK